jgi:hypothetical protein
LESAVDASLEDNVAPVALHEFTDVVTWVLLAYYSLYNLTFLAIMLRAAEY